MIITHPGSAHRDDFLSCCLLMAKYKFDVLRQEPTKAELENDTIFVVDVGGQYNSQLRNFDHHQFPRDHEPTCALSLVLKYFGYDGSIFSWFKATEMLDSKGPYQFCNNSGLTMDQLESLQSPIEAQMLRLFSQCGHLLYNDPLYTVMESIGQSMSEYLSEFSSRVQKLHSAGIHELNGITILDARIEKKDPVLAVEYFCKNYVSDTAVTITYDDRGDGFTLFRRNDDKRIDFSKIEKEPGVIFAHKNGFIAKVLPNVNCFDLINKARV